MKPFDAVARAREIVTVFPGDDGWKVYIFGDLMTWQQTEAHDELMADRWGEQIAAALTAVRDEERARIADWYQETFCPRAGVKGDEKHARGDCEPCNLAAAIRHQEGA